MVAFSSADYKPLMPRELRAKRSVAIWRLHALIYDDDPNAIKHELHVNNPWYKAQDILTFQKGKALKCFSYPMKLVINVWEIV